MKNKYLFVLVLLVSILVASFGFTSVYVNEHQQTEDEELAWSHGEERKRIRDQRRKDQLDWS